MDKIKEAIAYKIKYNIEDLIALIIVILSGILLFTSLIGIYINSAVKRSDIQADGINTELDNIK